jgi:hypothetical protein
MMEERRGFEGRNLSRARGRWGRGAERLFRMLSQPLQMPERLATATLACGMRQVVTNHYVALVDRE